MRINILGIGAWGPGFSHWHQLASMLVGSKEADENQPAGPKPEIIPSNERRRAPLSVRLAVESSSQACEQANIAITDTACVFASGLGDTDITDYMCKVLCTEQKQISPTKFHNSVHNAAAGYWTISSGCMQSATSIAALEYSASMNLLEGISQCCVENRTVLLTFFDAPVSEPLRPLLKNTFPFAASLVIQPAANTQHCIEVTVVDEPTDWPYLGASALKSLYETNPMARILALLQLIEGAESNEQSITMPLSTGTSLKISNKK